MLSEPENKKKLDEILRRLETLEANQNQSLSSLSSPDSKDKLFELLVSLYPQIAFKAQYYYPCYWEALDGFISSGSPVTVAGGRLFLSTTSTGYVTKRVPTTGNFTFDKPSLIRFTFDVQDVANLDNPLTEVKAYAGTGHRETTASESMTGKLSEGNHYGIYLDGSTIYGVTGNGVESKQVKLITNLISSKSFNVEIEHYPNNRVDFYLSDAQDAIFGTDDYGETLYRGSIGDVLPSGRRTSMLNFSLESVGGDQRDIFVQYAEVIQTKESWKN